MTANQSSTLFLCRTPLQAYLINKIIAKKNVLDYDLVYFTQNDDETDRLHFNLLKVNANKSQYIFVKKQLFDLANHIKGFLALDPSIKYKRYLNCYIASIDSLFFRMILRTSPKSIFTFDDGAANIIKPGIYDGELLLFRAQCYTWFTKSMTPGQIKSASKVHYTIYNGIANIVPDDKIEFIEVFSELNYEIKSNEVITFFVGQPFDEYLTNVEKNILERYLKNQNIDYYLMHPRESKPIVDHVKFLDKKGELAEVAIFQTANGKKIRIISCFSSVILNVNQANIEKIYLSFPNKPHEDKRIELVIQQGCNVVKMEPHPFIVLKEYDA